MMDGDLRNMVMSFRVTELQTLLAYAGKNRSGRKNELQARALELVKGKSAPIVLKIKELYRSMQQSMAHQTTTASGLASALPAAYSSSTNSAIPHNQTRLFTSSSGYAGSSEKVLQGLTTFASYNGGQQKSQSQTLVSMPICPDVKMKRLPFYDIVSELIKPTSLMPQGMGRLQEGNYPFCLTPQQAADIASSKEFVAVSLGDQKLQYTMQVQLRFCALDTSTDQDDQFPPSICVKVNNKLVPLPHPIPSNRPGVEPKRPSRPLNVTNYVRLSPTMTNTVTVTWASDNSRGYAMSLYLVKKMTSSDLLNRLKQKGSRPADYSRGLIKELTAADDGDCMIAMTSLKVTIACPLGKCRMNLPCRATTCKHLQCFDANLFLQMNERKPTWVCPVCDKPTLFENLCIDGYFQEVISKMEGSECMEVELMPDGSWHAINPMVKKEKEEYSPPTKRIKSEHSKNMDQTIDLEDDIVIEEDAPIPSTSKIGLSSTASLGATEKELSNKKDTASTECIDLTLSSDEESDDVPVVRPRRKTGNPKYVIDDESSSSSSSSATTEGSAATCPASPVAPMSPACITLDSRSPSPEQPSKTSRRDTMEDNGNSNHGNSNPGGSSSSGAGAFSSVNSARERPISSSSTGPSRCDSRPGSSTSYDYGHTIGQAGGYPTRSNPPVSPNLFPTSGTGYLPFDGQNMWPSTTPGNYQAPYPPSDFNTLDFQNMDYFSYDTTRGGSSGGGFGGRNW